MCCKSDANLVSGTSLPSLHNADTEKSPPQYWWWRLLALSNMVFLAGTFQQTYHNSVLNNLQHIITHHQLQPIGQLLEVSQQWLCIVNAMWLGSMSASLLLSYVADTFGRRPTLQLILVLQCATTVCFAAVYSCQDQPLVVFSALVSGRLLAGVASGLSTGLSLLYVAELAPQSHRGYFIALGQVYFGLGDCIGTFVSLPLALGTEQTYLLALLAPFLCTMLLMMTISWIPESPRFTYFQANMNCAAVQSTFTVWQGAANAQISMDDLQEEYSHSLQAPKLTYRALFTVPEHWRAMSAMGIVVLLTTLNGNGTYTAFSTIMLQSAGCSHSAAANVSFALSLLKFVTVLPLMPLADWFGRRPLMLIGCVVCVLSQGAMLVAYCTSEQSLFRAGLVAGCLCVWTIGSVAIDMSATIVTNELFTQQARTKAAGLQQVLAAGAQLLTTSVFVQLYIHVGMTVANAPLTAAAAALTIYSAVCLPETAKKSFYQIHMAYFTKEGDEKAEVKKPDVIKCHLVEDIEKVTLT